MVAVEEFAEVATGGTPSTSVREYWEGGKIPWLNSGELNKGVITQSDNFITEAGLKNSSARMMPENTVMVALTGATTGISALLKIEACANQSVTGILPSEKHDHRFLLQYLRSIRDRIITDSWGGAQKHISQAYVKELKIPLPPLAEQRRIAELLDQAETLRAKRRAALAQLDSLTQSIFLDLFGDPSTNPKQFPTPRLVSAIELRGGFAFKSADYVADGIPLVRIGEVNRGGVTRESACFLPITHEAPLTRFIVRPGDMLMSLTGTTGKDDYGNVILLDSTFNRYFLNQRVALIEPKLNILDRHYLLYILKNPKIKLRLTSKSRGIRQANISNGDVLELELPVPPIELQREFARRVNAVEKLKTVQRASLAEMDALFASLQHRAFRGEL